MTATCSMAPVDLIQEIYPITTSGIMTRKEAPITIFAFNPSLAFNLEITDLCVKEIMFCSRIIHLDIAKLQKDIIGRTIHSKY